jgi:hypothetical protein
MRNFLKFTSLVWKSIGEYGAMKEQEQQKNSRLVD